ncbi:MAG TPA: DUF748 domain-containing protein [Chryseosolibacter sp.]|nr:DUF748 domain-containing protein [Chryseosolibacter sp.]
MSKKKKAITAVLIIIVVLGAFRIALPYIVLRYANNTLAELDGYRGHIEDIDIALIRGAYTIDSIYIHKYDSAADKQTPFFASNKIDFSLEWRALFKGEIVGEILFVEPMLRFTKDKVEPKDVRKDSTGFKQVLDELMPLNINRFEVQNGRIEYIDNFSKPRVDIRMTNTNIVALNLRNSYDSGELLPASIDARANIYDGTLTVKGKVNPLAEDPTFDFNAELKNTNLVKLNDFFQAYAKVDVNKGTFGLYTEMAAKNGRFEGYIKPLLKDLDILGKEDRKDNVLKQLWEAVAGGVSEIFENQPKQRVATKIPLRGSTKNLDTNVWYAIGEVLRNAFIQALQPAIDQEITISAVGNQGDQKKTFLEKVFGGEDEKKEKKDEK